ncbi:twin-arginine translocase subunit TatC [Acinetobacter guillouiae]|jgi:sec-independent protein translocase protein TatC|uniref:Sec-independent protein translocase protein TatC n=1 Tax=Acinetobacter guillouiae TaxID=106649 RepID=A0A6A1RT41_ACIGI|nr:twin-arginine translocase subunit TatC [Acinetobacter guillouiae]MDN5433593.1 twin-arginine translocase subunit TatC [Acinetobacter sp.]ENU58114.1 twin arginine-targeting protein translocase TatC [Acinetobacter guillouiae CIP 63.46]EPH37316.1 Twin-arginine translocation protein TatC [Acinetobacter guillouiae MSP4-18]KAB0627204.1 twin-arginine translocase subunit TatC [Acinetobacter guillouiae]MCF0263969.1 twin-arginine translocase subunit TatC [Acinetobacter guillouiae]
MTSMIPQLQEQVSEEATQLEAMPITRHLMVLRQHLFKIIGVLIVLFFCLLPFANRTYSMLSEPLRAQLPASSTMIATDVTATFMAPFKLNFFIALMLAMPFIIYQIWAFIKPALYEKEKSLAFPLLLSSICLFYSGIAFAYFIALPSILHFFISVSPDTVAPMTDINSYLSFCLKLFLVFGVTFEIPIITLVLILIGLVSTQTLVEKRRFIIVGCFFIAMFVTPPDAISMIMLAIPMWMLFELGLVFGKMIEKRKRV